MSQPLGLWTGLHGGEDLVVGMQWHPMLLGREGGWLGNRARGLGLCRSRRLRQLMPPSLVLRHTPTPRLLAISMPPSLV